MGCPPVFKYKRRSGPAGRPRVKEPPRRCYCCRDDLLLCSQNADHYAERTAAHGHLQPPLALRSHRRHAFFPTPSHRQPAFCPGIPGQNGAELFIRKNPPQCAWAHVRWFVRVGVLSVSAISQAALLIIQNCFWRAPSEKKQKTERLQNQQRP